MAGLFEEPEDATLLEPAEREGLLQTWITHRRDLNEAEEANILTGISWARRRRKADLLTQEFLQSMHRQMFGDIWAWAGTYRQTERNIGIPAFRIATSIRELLDDVIYWISHQTYSADEIAIRFHHRLVAIHPFPNGNGRHARLMADILAEHQGEKPFSWGSGVLRDTGALRTQYIAALQTADNHNIGPLLEFARS